MGGANATIRVLVADDHPVYVAVLDLRMPGMSAQALLQEAAGECAVALRAGGPATIGSAGRFEGWNRALAGRAMEHPPG
jgi:hypothetical protein